MRKYEGFGLFDEPDAKYSCYSQEKNQDTGNLIHPPYNFQSEMMAKNIYKACKDKPPAGRANENAADYQSDKKEVHRSAGQVYTCKHRQEKEYCHRV